MKELKKIGLGGGCHWCTEAVFQQLKGVAKAQQGYIASISPHDAFSEAVIVHYDPNRIPLALLFEVHLHTHQSTKTHSFREKYRSAIYYFDEEDATAFAKALPQLQAVFPEKIITQVLPFATFRASRESITDYYKKNPEAPFCKRYIIPKLEVLQQKYASYYTPQKED